MPIPRVLCTLAPVPVRGTGGCIGGALGGRTFAPGTPGTDTLLVSAVWVPGVPGVSLLLDPPYLRTWFDSSATPGTVVLFLIPVAVIEEGDDVLVVGDCVLFPTFGSWFCASLKGVL